MNVSKWISLWIALLLVPSVSAGQADDFKKQMSEEEIAGSRAEKYLAQVTSFGYIYVTRYHSGQDKQIRQNIDAWEIDEEMSKFLRQRFENDFAKFPYKFVSPFEWGKNPKIGHLQCRAWLHGNSYPIAYHVECNLGAGPKSAVLHDASLGITSVDRADKDIQEALDRMVSKFARIFFQVRGRS
ncbi:hypothetical protein AYO43_09215 [Nitrospira sp. SCGC AG-212-E16]|nr:hypothetical protein AYO43_09215 [Nitrospira sp. SCGC AG-212-E16]